jgi:NAD(P)-dependent dehydrogenase (short-subunit alcohol dehydrogenase family)
MGKLSGKIAVVTGASSGIGLAIAKRYAQEGAKVFITGRRKSALDEAVREIGVNAVAVTSDISNLADLDKLYEQVRQQAGHIDILCANAGIAEFVPLEYVTEEHYERLFDTNVKGTLFTVQKALPLLREGGSIILIGSNAVEMGGPAFSVYAASKGALRTFVRGWAGELAPRGIRANVLVPGAVTTPGWHGFAETEDQLQVIQQQAASFAVMNRMGLPDEIAGAALFLASDDSSFVTGSALYVDGGAALA